MEVGILGLYGHRPLDAQEEFAWAEWLWNTLQAWGSFGHLLREPVGSASIVYTGPKNLSGCGPPMVGADHWAGVEL